MLNDEQILELCLSAISRDTDQMNSYPGDYLACYILEDKDTSTEITNEELHAKMCDMVVMHEIKELTQGGYLHVNFDEDGSTVISLDDCADINMYLKSYKDAKDLEKKMEKIWGRLSEDDRNQIKIQLLKD